MENYPKFFHDKELTALEKENNIIYFRYIDKETMKRAEPFLTEEEIEILSKGDSHAIVGSALYSKVYSREKTKILKINSFQVDLEKQKIIVDYLGIPKGREYYLVDPNFLDSNQFSSSKKSKTLESGLQTSTLSSLNLNPL